MEIFFNYLQSKILIIFWKIYHWSVLKVVGPISRSACLLLISVLKSDILCVKCFCNDGSKIKYLFRSSQGCQISLQQFNFPGLQNYSFNDEHEHRSSMKRLILCLERNGRVFEYLLLVCQQNVYLLINGLIYVMVFREYLKKSFPILYQVEARYTGGAPLGKSVVNSFEISYSYDNFEHPVHYSNVSRQ